MKYNDVRNNRIVSITGMFTYLVWKYYRPGLEFKL